MAVLSLLSISVLRPKYLLWSCVTYPSFSEFHRGSFEFVEYLCIQTRMFTLEFCDLL